MALSKPLTLIVATTSNLGIGRNGNLPWPSLKSEMAYFARVTKRISHSAPAGARLNAVIMGRKTWESIPQRFRPLEGRINVIVSKTLNKEEPGQHKNQMHERGGFHVVEGFDEALDLLQRIENVNRLYVIGGNSIYAAALQHPATQTILLTRILQPDFECDTFFPTNIEGHSSWKRETVDELEMFTGEVFGEQGVRREEKGVQYEFSMFTRGGTA